MTNLETRPSDQATPVLLRFMVHPPERRSRGVIIASGCCTTCCCCCCCLHAVGGLMGALKTPPPEEPAAWTGFVHAQTVYWRTMRIYTPLAILAVGVLKGPWWGVGMLFFGIPVIQLLATVVAYLSIARADLQPADRAAAQATIGRMTRRTLVGTGIGLLIMSPVLLLLLGGLR